MPKWDSMSKKEAKKLQDRKLRAFIRYQVYPYSPYYKRLFKELGLDQFSIQKVEHLEKLPITRKEDIAPTAENKKKPMDLILQPDEGLVKKFMPKSKLIPKLIFKGKQGLKDWLKWEYMPVKLTFTTGRSAAPTMFTYTRYDLQILAEKFSRLAQTAVGDAKFERCVDVFPYAPHLAFLGGWYAMEQLGVLTLHTGGGKIMGTQKIIEAIEGLKPDTILTIPGYGYYMMRKAAEQGRDFSSIKVVVTGAEKVPPAMKKKMIDLLESMGAKDPKIMVLYGMTEARAGWAECTCLGQEGYHAFPDMGIVQCIDPKTGEVVGEGEKGEFVYTPMEGRGSVILRYGTGDMAVDGIVWEKCPACGRNVPRISSDIRRVSQIKEFALTKVKGTLVDLNAFVAICGDFPGIDEWQAEIRKRNDDPFDLDEFYIHVAPKKGVDFEELKKRMMERIFKETEVKPTDIRYCEHKELVEMLGLETALKEKRVADNRPELTKL